MPRYPRIVSGSFELPRIFSASEIARLEAWVRGASVREIVAVAARARSTFRTSLEDRQGAESAPFAAALTMHRSGWTRERGLAVIGSSREPFVVPFLLLRLDDIVPSLRDRAETALRARLTESLAPTWVRSLRLVELLRARKRGGAGKLLAEITSFLSKHPEALAAGARDEDPLVRLRAMELRGPDAYHEGLRDSDLRIRVWTARRVASKATTPEQKTQLLPILEAARSASIRLVALKARTQLAPGDDAPLERALLDHHAAVRYLARTTLRARHPERAFGDARARALAVIGDPRGRREELVGALGALADVGWREDAARARPYLADERPAVRHEAARTVALLEA